MFRGGVSDMPHANSTAEPPSPVTESMLKLHARQNAASHLEREAECERTIAEYELKLAMSRTSLEYHMKHEKETQRELKKEKREKAELEDQLRRLQDESAEKERSLMARLQESRREALEARDDLLALRLDTRTTITDLEHQLTVYKARDKLLEEELAVLRASAKQTTDRAADEFQAAVSSVERLKEDLARSHAVMDGVANSNREDTHAFVKALTAQAADLKQHNAALSSELATLRMHASKDKIDADRVHRLEQKLARAKALAQRGDPDLVAALQEKLLEWQKCLPLVQASGPADIVAALRTAQQAKLMWAQREAELIAQSSSELSLLQQTCTRLQLALDQATQKEELARKASDTCEQALGQVETKLLYVSKERDMLKRVLETYKEADTAAIALERTHCNDAKVAALETQLARAEKTLADKSDELQRALAEVTRLGAEAEGLAQELDKAQARISKGEYNPETTKILHVTQNPIGKTMAEKRAKEGVKSQGELEEMRLRLMAFEQQKQRIDFLESEVKQNTKFREQIRKMTANIRSLVSKVLGYSMGSYSECPDSITHFSLTSTFGQPEDQLVFHLCQEGDFEMISTPFAESLESQLEQLRVHSSLPLFLANLTIDLFNKASAP